jgi:hypothetical protein
MKRRFALPAVVCPSCGHLDQVQRVSAVWRSGSATTWGIARIRGSFWGYGRGGAIWGSTQGTTTIEEDHATELSEALAPPVAPRYHNPWGLLSTLLLIAVLLSGWLAIVEAPGFHCASSGQRTICWDGQNSAPVQSALGITPDPVAFARWVQLGLVALPVSLLAGLLVLRWRLRARRRRRFQIDYQAWQEAHTSWSDLCYCHRCDGVFAPGERQLRSPAECSADFPV